MANIFKRSAAVNVGTSFAPVYAAPTGKTSMITQLIGCNLTNSGITVDVVLHLAAENIDVNILRQVPLPAGATIKIIEDDKLVCGPEDELRVRTSVANGADFLASLVEDVNG